MARPRVNPQRIAGLRGKRSREVIAHALRSRGHATDAKAIWRWENGRNQPNASILPDYAVVLGAKSVDDLYGDDDEEPHSAMTLDELLTRRIHEIVREAVQS